MSRPQQSASRNPGRTQPNDDRFTALTRDRPSFVLLERAVENSTFGTQIDIRGNSGCLYASS
jgi:hypothetical protein